MLGRTILSGKAVLLATAAIAGLASPVTALAQTAPDAGPAQVSEVVVTGKSGAQSARAISTSQTVLTGLKLEAIGAEGLQDYLTRTPGVVLNEGTPGGSSVTIRGVGTTTGLDQGQSPTGYYINDIPLTDPYYSAGTPDIDAFDVSNVSVYRGPQATLFGASSLGGAVNYQATPPDLTHFDAHVQATGEALDRSGGATGSAKAMVNVPIVDNKLAARIVYVYRDNPGFIDNVGTGEKGSNDTIVRGGRFELTWKPAASTTLNYFYLRQDELTADVGYSTPLTEGSYSKRTVFQERANFQTELNSLRLDQDLRFAVLTATATYHEKNNTLGNDLTGYLSNFFGPSGGPYNDGGPSSSKGVTFEVRLASNPKDKTAYVVGIYQDDTREELNENLVGFNPAGVVSFVDAVYGPLLSDPLLGEHTAADGYLFRSKVKTHGTERALFGEVTYHLTDTLKLNLGGRYFETSLNLTSTASGLFEILTAGTLNSTSLGSQTEKGFTPKGSITWTPNDRIMAYGLISQGFRFGGPNINPPEPGFKTPLTFKSDSLTNYEVGFRTDWFDHRLQFDPTFYYIDWSDIQLRQTTPSGFQYAANAGKATNYGAEFTTVFTPTNSLRIENNITYLSAHLNGSFAPGGAQAIIPKGATLPGASKWQVSTTATYSLPNLFSSPAKVLVSQRYISASPGIFGQSVTQGNYSLYDLRFNFRLPNGVELTPFVQNIGDERGVTAASNTKLTGFREYLVQPRTFGITLDFRR